MRAPIPIAAVDVSNAEDLVLKVLRSGNLTQGCMVARLEYEIRRLCNSEFAIAVSSGTAALVASLKALRLRPGDEVITSPFTFAATLNAILEANATARFVDILDRDFAIDADQIGEVVTSRTRVVMPVHLFGQMGDMAKIAQHADDNGLVIVEDAAQAIGARYDTNTAGGYGLGCFSLYATKNLTAGEGGVVTTDDAERARRLRLLRNQGSVHKYQYEMVGSNYRMTEISAAIGLAQLRESAPRADIRSRNAAGLTERLSDIASIVLPSKLPGRTHTWNQYTILLNANAAVQRDDLVRVLSERQIGTAVYYPRPVFDYPCYKEHPQVRVSDVPVTRSIAARCFTLPVHFGVTESDLDYMSDVLHEVLQ